MSKLDVKQKYPIILQGFKIDIYLLPQFHQQYSLNNKNFQYFPIDEEKDISKKIGIQHMDIYLCFRSIILTLNVII